MGIGRDLAIFFAILIGISVFITMGVAIGKYNQGDDIRHSCATWGGFENGGKIYSCMVKSP